MIVERLELWEKTFSGEAWRLAFEALAKLTPDSPDGTQELGMDGLKVIVMTVETTAAGPDTKLESHRRQIDIHMPLSGSERIEWFPAASLKVKTPYEEARDAMFYYRPATAPAAIDAEPGTVVVLFPDDAHAPAVAPPSGAGKMKKAVVKLPVKLVERYG